MQDSNMAIAPTHQFSTRELQALTALGGIFSVCGLAANLHCAWIILGLFPVAIMVSIIGRKEKGTPDYSGDAKYGEDDKM